MTLYDKYIKVEQAIAKGMNRWSIPAIRISFAIIFIWFGILKPFDVSSAEALLKATVAWLPWNTRILVGGYWMVGGCHWCNFSIPQNNQNCYYFTFHADGRNIYAAFLFTSSYLSEWKHTYSNHGGTIHH